MLHSLALELNCGLAALIDVHCLFLIAIRITLFVREVARISRLTRANSSTPVAHSIAPTVLSHRGKTK